MIYAFILGLAIIVGSLFQQFWIGLGVGLLIDVIVLVWQKYGSAIKKRRAEKKTRAITAVATTAGAGAHASAETTTGPLTKWFWRLVILGVVGWCSYSIYYMEGYPGVWLYDHHDKVEIENLQDKRVCLSGLKSGDWYLSYPVEVMKEHRYNENLKKGAGFYVAWPGGQKQMSFSEDIWINGIRADVDERVHVEPGGCFTITPKVAQAIKNVAVIYGNPDCATLVAQDVCARSATPRPAVLEVYFSGRKVPRR